MQYLKDNNYKAISLRDMAEYIDPVKAAKLPRKAPEFKESEPIELATEEKPYIAPAAKDIHEFSFPGLPRLNIFRTSVEGKVPYITDVTALTPKIKVSDGAVVEPASGVTADFSRPQTYIVTGQDGSKKTYVVTLTKSAINSANDILSFEITNSITVSISWSSIGVYVPASNDLKALAPSFTLSPDATAVPSSGTVVDFSRPQTYTVTAQDGSKKVYTVAVVRNDKPNSFTWNSAESGKWSDASKWVNVAGIKSALDAAGQPDCILSFPKAGNYDLENDFNQGFQLNQLDLNASQGHGIKLNGNCLTFKSNPATGVSPAIHVRSIFENHHITAPLDLGADLTVSMRNGSVLNLSGLVSGSGRLIVNTPDPEPDVDDHGFRMAILRLDNRTNTYSGGTVVSSGQVMVYAAEHGLGTGPVTLHSKGKIRLDNVPVTNSLVTYGGMIGGGPSWDGPIILNGNTRIAGWFSLNEKRGGGISGPGGLTMLGVGGIWGWDNNGRVSLYGVNTYTGPTTILRGSMHFKKAVSLYNADPAKWTPANICVATAATLALSAGGKDEFTGEQVSLLLKNLTTDINNNGLMRGSFFCIDTANATEKITISSDIGDSKGSGGGWFFLRKAGGGIVELTGKNAYTGQTFFEGGAMIVSSLNSVAGGKPFSSLGAPVTPETGTIGFGGDCILTYTGRGETTDRILDLTGDKQTVTLDQSGNGLLKFTSPLEISGCGHSKTIVLTGSGAGEFAGVIKNPYDRKNAATLSLTKDGAGAWTLSGANTYTGSTTVKQGMLSIASENSLGDKTEVCISEGAILELNFKGEVKIGKLYLDGKVQSTGLYSAENTPKYIKGKGTLKSQ